MKQISSKQNLKYLKIKYNNFNYFKIDKISYLKLEF